MVVLSHILGFPRIGVYRELKKSLESYWNGKLSECQLLDVGRQLRRRHWQQQLDSGIDLLPVGDFAWYDHVLTTSLMVDNIPKRHYDHEKNGTVNINTLFRVARGFSDYDNQSVSASDMTKWFNTNYHYIVPEFYYGQNFQLSWTQLLDEVDEALSLGYKIKPVLLGPLTYLWLGKIRGKFFNRLCLLQSLLPIYREVLEKLSQKGIVWVQIDEPILVLELSNEWQEAFYYVYLQLADQVKILLTTYFDTVHHLINLIREIPVQGIHIDCTVGNADYLKFIHNNIPSDWLLSVGIINGKNIWRADLYNCFKKLFFLLKSREFWIGSSCSLLHVPTDLCAEKVLDERVKNRLSFAIQKCSELFLLCSALNNINNNDYLSRLREYSKFNACESDRYFIHNDMVEKRIKDIHHISVNNHRDSVYKVRCHIQRERYNLPILPTTTIGSFPQTEEIRKVRLDFKYGNIGVDDYYRVIKDYIKQAIFEQEQIGLDILVHGEPERGDMVEYFGEQMDGFVFTHNGWVQSYGSRCVKPPIIIGDISRKNNESITVKWIEYAQSLTNKPVKGILTGPVTVLQWSFSREDISYRTIALQIALAIRDEVMDLENVGIGIIQIDEPALREGLPLKKSLWPEYLNWAVESFKISCSLVKDSTQIHTHMCYSEFDDIIDAIISLDVDVITIEASRSYNELLEFFSKVSNFNAIGPGVYDVHSPYVPDELYFTKRVFKMLDFVKAEYLWINPDCGLKTRSWTETIKSLSNMVVAVKKVRESIIRTCK